MLIDPRLCSNVRCLKIIKSRHSIRVIQNYRHFHKRTNGEMGEPVNNAEAVIWTTPITAVVNVLLYLQWCIRGSCVDNGSPAVHGNWGSWSEYTSCTRTCDGGVQHRTRECNSPRYCNNTILAKRL